MKASNVIIPVILLLSTAGAVLLPNLLLPSSIDTTNNQSNSLSVISFHFDYTNTSVDLVVTSNQPAELYIQTQMDNTTFVNKTDQLNTSSVFSFEYP